LKSLIVRNSELNESITDEHCLIAELINIPQDSVLSIAKARVKPGMTTAKHMLRGVSERYLIFSGLGRAYIGDMPPQDVSPGDLILIPPNTPQSIINIDAADLVFYCICSPGFTSDCYIPL